MSWKQFKLVTSSWHSTLTLCWFVPPLQNSNNDGVGYEVAIKEGALAGGPGVQRKPMSKGTGTKKVKAAKAKAAPKAGSNPGSMISNIFGSKDD